MDVSFGVSTHLTLLSKFVLLCKYSLCLTVQDAQRGLLAVVLLALFATKIHANWPPCATD